jgi:lipopolysaccharide heptosyltransferase II
MTTPAIRAVKESLPGRCVTLLTSRHGAVTSVLIPEVDETLIYDAPWMKATPPRSSSRLDRNLIRQLQRRGFDGAVIFTVFSQNPLPAAMLCFLADIPLRVAHCRENPYQLLTHWVKEQDELPNLRHEVRRQLDLTAAVGFRTRDERIRVPVSAQALEAVMARLEALGADLDRPWLVVHPGATAPSRRYPAESYCKVARRLALEDCFQVVFTGTGIELDLVSRIQAGMDAPSFSLAGKLNLPELVALIGTARILIANNTGPVHLAAGVGTPVVDLYALTNPQHTPWMVPNRVLNVDVPCKFCLKSECPEGHHNCLSLVEPDAVVQAVRELLNEVTPQGREAPIGV